MEYDPFSLAVQDNPYPFYASLRRDHPVYRVEALGGAYAVSRYDDVAYVLAHPELFSSTAVGMTKVRGRPTRLLIAVDPPDHTRMRSLVNRAFAPQMVADLTPRIREVTDELLAPVLRRGEFDLIADLAVPLPVTIIAEILGVDPARHEDFKRWSDNTLVERSTLSPEERVRSRAETDAFQTYLEAVIAERRVRPRGDLISVLVQAHGQEKAISADEVVAFVGLLLIAGNETTTNLIGNAILALLEHPDQLTLLRNNPSLLPNAVEEALRYDTPTQLLFRTATCDVELAGMTIPKGATVVPIFASANRDECKFPEPDRFDVRRDARGHLAFGHGIHFCLGAPLARLEARIALEAVLRLPGLHRTDERVEQVSSFFMRGAKRLPLAFTPRSESRAVS
jgi:cytochrome P450